MSCLAERGWISRISYRVTLNHRVGGSSPSPPTYESKPENQVKRFNPLILSVYSLWSPVSQGHRNFDWLTSLVWPYVLTPSVRNGLHQKVANAFIAAEQRSLNSTATQNQSLWLMKLALRTFIRLQRTPSHLLREQSSMREPRFPLHQRWLCAFNTSLESFWAGGKYLFSLGFQGLSLRRNW